MQNVVGFALLLAIVCAAASGYITVRVLLRGFTPSPLNRDAVDAARMYGILVPCFASPFVVLVTARLSSLGAVTACTVVVSLLVGVGCGAVIASLTKKWSG